MGTGKARAKVTSIGGIGCVACTLGLLLAGAGCGSSSSGGATDGGDDVSYYTTPGDGSADGEGGGGGDGAPDGPTCVIPAAATYSYAVTGGTAMCAPQVANGQCDSSSFRELCSGPNPADAPLPGALDCQLLPNTDPAVMYACCSCQQGAPSGDP